MKFPYRSEIDGLRALAVIPVIFFHAGVPFFEGGFLGVDIFFVISGYLITSILLMDLDRGNFSLANFYERRARRILPALISVCIACIPFAYFLMIPSQFEEFGKALIAVALFISNITFWRQSGYFGADAELNPLLHTWSLAVEEQYYLFFPILLWALWKFGRKSILPTISIIALFSLAAYTCLGAFCWFALRILSSKQINTGK